MIDSVQLSLDVLLTFPKVSTKIMPWECPSVCLFCLSIYLFVLFCFVCLSVCLIVYLCAASFCGFYARAKPPHPISKPNPAFSMRRPPTHFLPGPTTPMATGELSTSVWRAMRPCALK